MYRKIKNKGDCMKHLPINQLLDFCDQFFLKKTVEEISDLQYGYVNHVNIPIGKIIAAGKFSMVIDLERNAYPEDISKEFKNPVMIISVEKHKADMFRKIAEEKVVKIDYDSFLNSQYELWKENNTGTVDDFLSEIFGTDLSYILALAESCSNYDISMYFTEKLEILDMKYEIGLHIFDSALDLIGEIVPETIQASPVEILSYIENIRVDKDFIEHLENCEERFPEVFQDQILEIANEILRSSEIALNVAEESDIQSVSLDIHEHQFVKKGDKIICVDPILQVK